MTTWWSTERITATISQEYVERELGSLKNREALHRVLRFGDGLTDDTYLDWVLERSPRFFLILNDIGCPEKIFDIVDRSFDDDDLPLDQDALWELNLFGTKSETLDKKFHRQQFSFLVQELEPGGHVEYGPWEVVPVESVRRGTIGNTSTVSDKVCANEHLYTRKKVSASGEDGVDKIHFILHLRGLAKMKHAHLVSIFATYTHDDFHYVLLAPCAELNLKQILDDQSKQFKLLEKKDRREIVLTWMHCIVSAVAYLHSQGFAHRGIRPSVIMIDQNSKVVLSDYRALGALDRHDTSKPYNAELYEHSPPEHWIRKPCLHETAALKTQLPGGGRTSRRLPKVSAKVTEIRLPPTSPVPGNHPRPNSRSASSSGSSTSPRPRNALITTFAPQDASSSLIVAKQYPSDIFSLSAVVLTLLSYLLGHSPKSFASHRCRINRQAGRGNAPPDASFHKNLKQVGNWMDKLAKEAGQKEKKDVKFWGAVVEMIGVCRLGLKQDPAARISAVELEKNVAGWVDWGLDRKRRCTCRDQNAADEVKAKVDTQGLARPRIQPPKRTSERISYIHETPARYWTTVSEDVSTAFPTVRNSLATTIDMAPRRKSQPTGVDTPAASRSVAAGGATGRRNSSIRNSLSTAAATGARTSSNCDTMKSPTDPGTPLPMSSGSMSSAAATGARTSVNRDSRNTGAATGRHTSVDRDSLIKAALVPQPRIPKSSGVNHARPSAATKYLSSFIRDSFATTNTGTNSLTVQPRTSHLTHFARDSCTTEMSVWGLQHALAEEEDAADQTESLAENDADEDDDDADVEGYSEYGDHDVYEGKEIFLATEDDYPYDDLDADHGIEKGGDRVVAVVRAAAAAAEEKKHHSDQDNWPLPVNLPVRPAAAFPAISAVAAGVDGIDGGGGSVSGQYW